MKKIILTLFVLMSLFIAGCSQTQEMTGYEDYDVDSFAQCLTQKGAKMYGTATCPHCKNQKMLFGDSFKYVDYVDCMEENQKCVDAGLSGVPAWEIGGEIYIGEQSFYELGEKTGCKLELR